MKNNNERIENILEQAEIFQDDTLGYGYMSKEELNNLLEQLLSEMLDTEIKWLQSVLDTKHINEDSRWIIEGRIDKLKERLQKLKGDKLI